MKKNSTLNKIEDKFEDWLKPFPHLPIDWRIMIADNAWWVSLIGLILAIVVMFNVAFALLMAFSLLSFVAPFATVYITASNPMLIIGSIVSLIASVATIVFIAMSIKPLKNKDKKGWDLMFLASVVSFALSAISGLLMFQLSSILGAAIGLVIGMYVLLEVKSYFKEKSPKTKESKK